MKSLLLAVVAALVLALPATAAKPSDASVSASCNPCAAGSAISFSGSGFDEGPVVIALLGDAQTQAYSSDGSFSADWNLAGPGEYQFVFYQRQGDHKQVVKASLTIQVV